MQSSFNTLKCLTVGVSSPDVLYHFWHYGRMGAGESLSGAGKTLIRGLNFFELLSAWLAVPT